MVKLLAYLAKMRQSGMSMTGTVDCGAAIKQNFSSSKSMTQMGLPTGPTEAAHFLPGQIRIGGQAVWQFVTNPETRDQIEFMFGEVEHLPVTFNQADTAAEANGLPCGLCSALATACAALIRQSNSNRTLTHLPHPNSPAGRSSDWSSVGLPHPDSPVGRSFDWSSVGLPHPDSPVSPSFNFSAEPQGILQNKSLMELVEAGFEVWHRGAIAGLTNGLAKKDAKPGIPPLVGDRFEGYTMESPSTASNTAWNRDNAVGILKYYLEDQRLRTWSWVMGSCQGAMREVELNYKK